MYSCGPPLMDVQVWDDQHELTYSSYVRTRVVILKTCRRRWVIGRNGERRSGISAQTARHDDDDIYIYIYIYTLFLQETLYLNFFSIILLTNDQELFQWYYNSYKFGDVSFYISSYHYESSSSSLPPSYAESTVFHDSLSPSIPIIHHPWQVCICTEKIELFVLKSNT